MSASAYRRLRSLLRPSTPTIPRPTKTPKPTVTAAVSAADVSPPLPEPTVESEDGFFTEIVAKFKESSDLHTFRDKGNLTYQSTVLRLAAAQKFSYIEEILEYQKRFESITQERFTARLIGLYGKAGMYDHARKLFDEMPQLNCERTSRSFNALLNACVISGEFDEITQLLADLPEKLSIKPDVISYNILLKAFCEKGSLDLALSVIDKMEETGLKPNVVSFNTLLNALSQNGNIAEAEKVWALMEDKNVVPNVRSYNPMLRALVADKRLPEAVKLFEEMKSKEIKPDTISFNALIEGCHDQGNLEEARSWHEEMKKEDCSPDQYTLTLLVQLACDKGDFVYGFELCKASITRRRRLLKTPLLQLVVDGLVRGSKMEEANELIKLDRADKIFHYKLEVPSAE